MIGVAENSVGSVKTTLGSPLALLIGIIVVITGCDVNNPGPVRDRFLNSPDARPGVVTGIEAAYQDYIASGCNEALVRNAGAVAREIYPAGNTGSCGIDVQQGIGNLTPDRTGDLWELGQNVRFVAEEAVARFRESMGSFASNPLAAEALIWAGFANKTMGANFCQAVIDGGSLQSHTVFFERAEEFFDEGLEVAEAAGREDLVNRALAGRAQNRVMLGNWDGAAADANRVPREFEFEIRTFNISQDQFNGVEWAQRSQPYRTISVWNTPNWQYYQNSGDPRVEWREDPKNEFGDSKRAELGGDIPFLIEEKYTGLDDNIDIADGREMLLIRAEALLVDGAWNQAMSLINEVRTSGGASEREANSLEEAWTFLKAERRIELWLEARRMADLRRWQENDVPGSIHPLEDASNPETKLVSDRDLCYPVPNSERETNPNIPLSGG